VRCALELTRNLLPINMFDQISLTTKVKQRPVKILRGSSIIAKREKNNDFLS